MMECDDSENCEFIYAVFRIFYFAISDDGKFAGPDKKTSLHL